MKVLFVDDDKLVAQTVALALVKEGHDCLCVRRGERAIRMAKNADFDILVLDIGLPDIDGYDVLNRLRSAGVETPVLLQSGLPEDKRPGGQPTINGEEFLAKPFSIGELVDRMEAVVRRERSGGRDDDQAGDGVGAAAPPPAPEEAFDAPGGGVGPDAPLPEAAGPMAKEPDTEPDQCPAVEDPEADGPEMGRVGRRRHTRYSAFSPAVVVADGQSLPCVVRDISVSGAQIRFSEVDEACPVVFTLRPVDGPERRCKVRWRSGSLVGVEFAEAAPEGGVDAALPRTSEAEEQ